MCAFRKALAEGANGSALTWATSRSNAGRGLSPVVGKICRGWAPIAGQAGSGGCQKARFYGAFGDGTALAEELAWVRPQMRHCRSSAMLLALGAASAAIDALQALTSSKSVKPSTGFGQGATNPFDFSASASPS